MFRLLKLRVGFYKPVLPLFQSTTGVNDYLADLSQSDNRFPANDRALKTTEYPVPEYPAQSCQSYCVASR